MDINTFLEALMVALLTSILISVRGWRWVAARARRAVRVIPSAPNALLKLAREEGFEPHPKQSRWRTSTDLRRWRKSSDHPFGVENPPAIYRFFCDPEVKLREFKGFLIPPLDTGHQNAEWWRYLERMGDQAREMKKRHPDACAIRIVFFERYLLNLVIRHPEVLQVAEEKGAPFKSIAAYIKRTVEDTLRIHEACENDPKAIECFYADKASIDGDQYYDFGLYGLGNERVVYQPAFRKDVYKTISNERLFFSRYRRHFYEIIEFERDFDDVLKKCRKYTEWEELPQTEGAEFCRKVRDRSHVSLRAFQAAYYHPIKECLKRGEGATAESSSRALAE